MATHGTYYCPELSCQTRVVKRLGDARGPHYVCPACKTTLEIPEREKMLAAGAAELPGFEKEGN